MYREAENEWNWETWRLPWWAFFRPRWYAKASLVVERASSMFPALELDYHLDFMGVSLGYTTKAWTRKGLEKKMRKIEEDEA